MHRISVWLRSTNLTEDELHLVLQFLLRLCDNEGFTKYFLSTQLESLLSLAKLVVRADTRDLINQLLGSVKCIDMYYEGSPTWNDNRGTPLHSSRSKASSTKGKVEDQQISSAITEKGQGEAKTSRSQEFYFRSPNVASKKNVRLGFGIPTIQLQATDRRVFSSAVESILSKDENLTFITTCFLRDVLLEDFPAEIFIQESSAAFSLFQVLEESWENEIVNYSAFQALLKLSSLLRSRINCLDSSDFYDHRNHFERHISRPKSSINYRYMDSDAYLPTSDSSSEYFLNNLMQFIKALVRGLTYKSKGTYVWLLINSYSFTLHEYLKLFPTKSSTTLINLQEILLELSQFFLKFSRNVHTPLVAVIMTTLLSSMDNDVENLILSKDIRHTIWNLTSHTSLQEMSPITFQYFVEAASQFDSSLDSSSKPKRNDDSYAIDNFYNDWWKYDKSDYRNTDKTETTIEDDPESKIRNILYSIQNATEHKHVKDGIDLLWESSSILMLNSRKNTTEHEQIDVEVISEQNITHWREAFDKFLLAEPTCPEDEDLLARVLDLLGFLLSWLNNCKHVREWIEPMVTERGSAILHFLIQSNLDKEVSHQTEGTALSTCLRSVLDFYNVTLFGNVKEPLSPTIGLEFVKIYAEILERIAVGDYNNAATLHCILYGLANLTSMKGVVDMLSQSQYEYLSTALVNFLVECIYVSNDKSGSESFRNRMSIHYATRTLLHLVVALCRNKNKSLDWSSRIIAIIPVLWSSNDSTVRSMSFQICEILTRTSNGVIATLQLFESPALLWSCAYSQLLSRDEVPVVRWAAGEVVLNLLKSWDEMKRLIDPLLQVPKWKILQDLTGLLENMYWYSKLSHTSNEALSSEDDNQKFPIITPKVLQLVGKLIFALLSVSPEDCAQNQGNLRELCVHLFRVIGNHEVSDNFNEGWWLESFQSLSISLEALTSCINLSNGLSSILFADKTGLSVIVRFFAEEIPEGFLEIQAKPVLERLWYQSTAFVLLLSSVSAMYFEDLERIILTHKSIVFPKLIQWLHVSTIPQYRKISLEFLTKFLKISYAKVQEGKERTILFNLWQDAKTEFSDIIYKELLSILKTSTNIDERISSLICCDTLFQFFKSDGSEIRHDLIKTLVKNVRAYGTKSIEVSSQFEKKDLKSREELKWTFSLLSTMFHRSIESRQEALIEHISDAFHTTKITSQVYSNTSERVLLHSLVECLVNFTYEFPEGAHSLTLTTGLIGVPSRKIATPNSLFIEILGLLQNELDSTETCSNLQTIDLIMSVLNNVIFSLECRNILVKTNILNFIQRLHYNKIKKWNIHQQHVKLAFMQFLVHLTSHSDMQLHLGKVDEAIDVLVQLSEFDNHPGRLMALEILRNLSFNQGNRPRLITDPDFLRFLSEHLRSTDSIQEVECSVVAIWALISNFERGKVAAKNYNIGYSLAACLQKLQNKTTTTKSKDQEAIIRLTTLIETISSILSS